MVKEAVDLRLIRRPAASALKSKHDAIRGLRKYWELTARIFQWNLLVLGSNEARHRAAQRIRSAHGLLTNDLLIAAACFERDIRSLATRDADFDLIPELTVTARQIWAEGFPRRIFSVCVPNCCDTQGNQKLSGG